MTSLLAVRNHGSDHGVDVSHRTLDSPFGSLLVAATDDGIVRVAFEGEDHRAIIDELAGLVGPRDGHQAGPLDTVARQLDEYFAGTRRAFDVPLDLRLARGFHRTVLDQLLRIPYGTTQSYATVAAASGRPRAVRSVGTACARNPLPLLIPCHRVVRSDGTIGRYGGGTHVKQALLTLEAT
jgi:methylated-DNA-[protein]-cysteine S-methyltransferase